MIYKFIKKNIDKKNGFVVLFVVMLSAIILSITLGISNVALKEVQFAISAKDANDAFFAADIGAECALFLDKDPLTSPFVGASIQPNCAGIDISPILIDDRLINLKIFDFGIILGQKCVLVRVEKTIDGTGIITATKINSKGYNSCSISGLSLPPIPAGNNLVERELEVRY